MGAVDALLHEHRACRRQGEPIELPAAFDGVPTLGGFQWLRHTNASRATWQWLRNANATLPEARGPLCHFCNASAGCCASGVGTQADRRRLYSCRACY